MNTINFDMPGDTSARPIHPGKLVRERMTELGVTVRETAKRLGVSRPHLQNVLACRRAISAQMAVRLERALGRSAEDWLLPQVDYDVYQARLQVDVSPDQQACRATDGRTDTIPLSYAGQSPLGCEPTSTGPAPSV